MTFDDVDREILILDEPDFGVDFNGDGDNIDNNARAFENVTRAYQSHLFGLSTRLKFTKTIHLKLGYDIRLKQFNSEEEFDVARVNRVDTRHRAFAQLSIGSFYLEYSYTIQDTDRPQDVDQDGVELDYVRNIVTAGFLVNF